MKETENDELTAVIQKLVVKYQDDIMPIALDMITHLANIFKQVPALQYLYWNTCPLASSSVFWHANPYLLFCYCCRWLKQTIVMVTTMTR